MTADLSVDRVPQIEPEFLAAAVFVLQTKVISLVGDSKILTSLKQMERFIVENTNGDEERVKQKIVLSLVNHCSRILSLSADSDCRDFILT